jgi:hypothetical protein
MAEFSVTVTVAVEAPTADAAEWAVRNAVDDAPPNVNEPDIVIFDVTRTESEPLHCGARVKETADFFERTRAPQ